MIPLRTPRRILLIRRRALGDALVTLPAVLAVRAAWPAAAVDLVVDRPFAPLLLDLLAGRDAGIQVVSWPLPGPAGWVARLRGAGYDLVIDWLGNPRTALWTALSGAAVRVGYDLPRRRWAYNVRVPRERVEGRSVDAFAGESFLDPLRTLGVEVAPWRSGCAAGYAPADGALGEAYRQWRQRWDPAGRRPTAVIMSATWPAKAWPAGHVVRLVRMLEAAGAEPLVILGPGDAPLGEALRPHLEPALFAPPTSLVELADPRAACRACVGTDNGSRHLAAALGVPTVTLFGPTSVAGWNPPGPRHVPLRTGEPCSPCNLTECPVEGHPCLEGLQPGRVAEAVTALTALTNRRTAGAGGKP